MKVQVKLFAAAHQLTGTSVVEVQLDDAATVADLRRELVRQHPALMPLSGHMLIAVDQEYAEDSVGVSVTSELAAIPPVSGG